jgi:2-hydroxychromene-2-carboxylate isomerase
MYAHLDQTFNQMTEYRARTIAMDSDHQGLVGPPASSQALEEPPAFMSLAEQYGLTDEDLGASESDDHSIQTIEQEYQAYVTAPLCAKGTRIIKWWEVSQKID